MVSMHWHASAAAVEIVVEAPAPEPESEMTTVEESDHEEDFFSPTWHVVRPIVLAA